MKQKILLLAMALLGCMNVAQAKDGVTSIQDATIKQGGFGCITLKCKMQERTYNALQIEFALPEGLKFNQGVADYSLTGISDPRFVMTDKKSGKEEGVFIFMNMDSQNMKNGEYDVVKIYFKADKEMEVDTYPITITALSLSGSDGKDYSPFSNVEAQKIDAPLSFNVNIVEPSPRVFDEENREVFEDSYTYEYRDFTETVNPKTGKTEYDFGPKETVVVPEDVVVKRTIKAKTWSTICMPFDIDGWTCEDIFGEFQLASISNKATFDEKKKELVLSFNTIPSNSAEIKKNTPYLIKTNNDISEFDVEGITAKKENIGSEIQWRDNNKVFHSINCINSYCKQLIPQNGIFLSDNKFYYSTGESEIKGFRNYFVLDDYFTEAIFGGSSSININVTIDDELTAIEGLSTNYRNNDDVYSVSGVYMGKASEINKLSRGIYIVNGKKVIVK